MSSDRSFPAAAAVPPPAPGSVRYFVLLYTPAARRGALATLLAVADELGAGLHRLLDHGVAHVRLEWWRQEAERSARGVPAHPWLIALRSGAQPALPLQALVEAALLDLAEVTLRGGGGRHLARARLLAAAGTLGAAPPSAGEEQRLSELAAWIDELDATPPVAGGQGLPGAPAVPGQALQPVLAPLLVWAALARAAARRRLQRAGRSGTMNASAWDGLADNFTAWRSARRARRGRFSFEADPSA